MAFLRSFGSRKERNERFLLAGANRRISVITFDFSKKFNGDCKMNTTVLVFVDRENTSMGMRIASQEEFTQILIKNKELPLQERRLFTKDVIADTDGLDVMYIETGLPDYQKWNSKQTYRNKIQNAKRKYKFLSTDTLCANEDAGDLTDFIADSFCVEKAVVEKETMRQLRAALENWKPWANEVLRFYLNGKT